MRPTLRFLFLASAFWLLAAPGASHAPPVTDDGARHEAETRPVQERVGSTVPCAVPLRWRLADIDPRFGLSRDDAEAALRAAFVVWEDEIGEPIFTVAESGHPISFEYDQRQATTQRRRTELDDAAGSAQRLESMTARLEDRLVLQDRANLALTEAVEDHRRRTQRLNEEIGDWNQRRSVPDSVRTRLMGQREALAEEGRELQRRQEALREASEELAAESRRLNQEIEAYNREQMAQSGVPMGPSQAGRYSEEVRTRNGQVEDVRRRIEVYRYESMRDLITVLAHELGHALGLGHAGTQGALMSAVSTSADSDPPPALGPRDLAMLEATCPGLRSGSGQP